MMMTFKTGSHDNDKDEIKEQHDDENDATGDDNDNDHDSDKDNDGYQDAINNIDEDIEISFSLKTNDTRLSLYQNSNANTKHISKHIISYLCITIIEIWRPGV